MDGFGLIAGQPISFFLLFFLFFLIYIHLLGFSWWSFGCGLLESGFVKGERGLFLSFAEVDGSHKEDAKADCVGEY